MPVSALLLSHALLSEDFRWLHLAGCRVASAGALLIFREHAPMSTKVGVGAGTRVPSLTAGCSPRHAL